MDKEQEIAKLRNAYIEGLKASSKKMIEEKKKLGHKIVISENGVIKVIDPRDLK